MARRRLAAAEGNHVASGGAAAEVDAAYDTFDPPIRQARPPPAPMPLMASTGNKGESQSGHWLCSVHQEHSVALLCFWVLIAQ